MGLFDIFSSSDAEQASRDKINGLNLGYGQASDLFTQGRQAVQANYGQGINTFQNLTGLGANGENAYADATGANGSAGNARAVNNFQANPGYQFAFNQGLQGVDRGAASRGMLNSGNTLQAEQKYGNDIGNQEYGNYVSRLSPFIQQQTTANTVGANGAGSGYYGEGNTLNSSLGNQGNLAYQTQAGIGNANASADMAKYGASQNMFGALMGGANMLAGFL